MVFRTLLATIITSLLAFTAAAMPNSGTSIQCSNSVFQESLRQIKTSVQTRAKTSPRNPGMPKEVYTAVRELSNGTFAKQIVTVGEEIFSIGPTYFDGVIRVNKKYYGYLKTKVNAPVIALNFVLSHELAHHVEGLYSLSVSRNRNSGGMVWDKMMDPYQREIYAHAHVDCLGLSLMKNAGMTFDLKNITDTLETIRDECYPYRGKPFCETAHAVRVEHVKRWFDSIKDVK